MEEILLVRGGKFKTLEGETYSRTVIWEFPSHEQAMKCHDSKEYQDGWALAKDYHGAKPTNC